jgi:hypothetical protein
VHRVSTLGPRGGKDARPPKDGVRAPQSGYPAVMGSWAPAMTLRERDGRCRLALCGLTHGEGVTLQEAADDLVARLLAIAQAACSGGMAFSSDLHPPDRDVMAFLRDVAGLSGEREELRRFVLRGP